MQTKQPTYRKRCFSCAFLSITLLALTGIANTKPGYAADTQSPTQPPLLLELFTSEGCSSCPPVDAWVQQLDATQPVPGAQIIVLSEHVDYWDHDGWKDPYSSAQLTERQHDYANVLGLNSVYTPQLILDGTIELHAGAPQTIAPAIDKERAAPKLPIRIVSAGIEPGLPATLRGNIEVNGTSSTHSGDVYIATALDHASSQVVKGENSGHLLTYVSVVQDIQKVGRLKKGKTFNGDFQIKLKPDTDAANVRVIAFVQESGPGKILGVAMEKNIAQVRSKSLASLQP